MATYTWNGGNGAWTTAGNWSLGATTTSAVPGATDDVIIAGTTSLEISVGTASANSITISDPKAAVVVTGVLTAASIADGGLIRADGGTVVVTGAVTGAGTIAIADSGTVDLRGAYGPEVFQFKDGPGLLKLAAASGTSTVQGLQPGDTIDLVGVGAASVTSNKGTITVANASKTIATFVATDGPSNTQILASSDGAGGIKISQAGGVFYDYSFLSGNNTVTAAGSSNSVHAGTGRNLIKLLGGRDEIFSEGDDTVVASGGTLTVNATTGRPLVFGNDAALKFVGGDGACSVVGGTAGNTVTGGSGSMLLFASGSASYTGATGSSTIVGGNGTLDVDFGRGGGIAFGGKGHNALRAGLGNTTLVGANDGDVLTATGSTRQVLVAASGAETLNGSAATGNNIFFGGTGADSILGGSGNDLFVVGTGNETLTGGGGTNAFAFVAGTAARTDVITDFDPAKNAIALYGYGDAATAAATAIAGAVTTGSSTTITLSDKTTIVFTGAPTLHSYNFF